MCIRIIPPKCKSVATPCACRVEIPLGANPCPFIPQFLFEWASMVIDLKTVKT